MYHSIDQLPGKITVKVSNSSWKPLLRLGPSEAKTILDIFVSIDENEKDQIQHVLDKTG